MSTNAAPRLHGLLIAQLLGAFNDNALKLFMALLAIRGLQASLSGAELEAAAQGTTTLAFVVFTLPLMLVSLPAAWLADRFSKRSILIGTKALELGLMAAGTLALWLQPGGGVLGLGVLAAMGAQSALFSPAKYGILPELLPRERLAAGNGVLEMTTFLAIIAGTAAGGTLLDAVGVHTWLAGVVLMVLSLAGLLAVRLAPAVPAAAEGQSLVGACRAGLGALRADRVLWLASVGAVVFWALASLVTQDLLVYAKTTLSLSPSSAGLPLAACGVGIGLGSWAVGRLSRGGIELGWVPVGAAGMALAAIAVGLGQPGLVGSLLLVLPLGLFAGFVAVPLNAVLQDRAPASCRGAVIALTNVLVFGGVLGGSLGAGAMAGSGLSPAGILVGAGVAALLATVWAIRLLPEAGLRMLLVLLTHSLYRLRVHGRQHVPVRGGALLVGNHMSFVDGLLLIASQDRPVRFIVHTSFYERWWLRPLMKVLGAIPISSTAAPRELLQSMRRAGEQLDAGELVCIFAEGEITRTGQLLPFQRGLERLLGGRGGRRDVPVIPVYLDRVWGSPFSFAGGRFLRRLPWPLPRPVSVHYGAPLPSTSDRYEVRQAVTELGAEAWQSREHGAELLHVPVVRRARRAPWRFACADPRRARVSRLGLLCAAVTLARRLRPTWRGQARVGLMLPPSTANAALNLAASLAGRVVVNLNYTIGPAALASCVRQAELGTILTSRELVEKAGLEFPEGVPVVWLEEVAAGIRRTDKLAAALLALLAPVRLLERACGRAQPRPAATDPATVIFSSGSTGEPKGVVLSHFNVDVNGRAVAQVLPISAADSLLGILPPFHSFGTMTFWLALHTGMAQVFHQNPLDGAAVGALVERYGLTAMLATPTFLQIYTRRCAPGQLGSLRFVVTGAEKLPARVAEAFEDRFGIRPLEGYGTTECSPVVAVSTPGFRGPGFYQPGSRRGCVGHPLPGVALRIVDPDTREPVPSGEPGMLLVKGPNVMLGYLGRDDLTAGVLRDGWYVTGDIATLDGDGYLRITDRLARFSKIGGEMVPHGVVEAALQEAAGGEMPQFAVTGVPCERKGEKLAVLHTVACERIEELRERIAAGGLPNLFVPRVENFVLVDELPMLGTGKLDLRAVRRIARERLAAEAAGVG